MVHDPYDPTVRLLCHRCRKPTAHIMTSFSNNPLSALTLVYECQECGEIKKAYDLNTLPELSVPVSKDLQYKEPEQKVVEPAVPIERGPQITS